MKRIKIVAPCLLVACALAGAGASSAAAALPELGRCVKTMGVVEGKRTHYSGAYTNKNCTHLSATHKGPFEFEPGPGAKNKFFATGIEPEPTLVTTTGATVTCSSLTLKGGEYTGPKTAKVSEVFFEGCQSEGVNCRSTVSEGEIKGTEFTMELGVISSAGTKPVVGWDLKKEGVAFSYTCGKLPEVRSVQTLEGSVIAPLKSGTEWDVNRMSIKALLLFKAPAGKQLPEAFEGGANDTLKNTTITEGLTKTEAQAGLTNNLEIESGLGELGIENPENQEPLEIKTVA